MTCSTTAHCLPGYTCQSGVCDVPATSAAKSAAKTTCTEHSATEMANPHFCNNTIGAEDAYINLPRQRATSDGVFTTHYSHGGANSGAQVTNLGVVPVYSVGDFLFNVGGGDRPYFGNYIGTINAIPALMMSTMQIQQLPGGSFRVAYNGGKSCLGIPRGYDSAAVEGLVVNTISEDRTEYPVSQCSSFSFVENPALEATAPLWACGAPGTPGPPLCSPVAECGGFSGQTIEADFLYIAMRDLDGKLKYLEATFPFGAHGTKYYAGIVRGGCNFFTDPISGPFIAAATETYVFTADKREDSAWGSSGRVYTVQVAQGA